jgi:drug/metabolite transporter (DMT)-like permease
MVLESFSFGLIAGIVFGVADILAAVVARRVSVIRLLLWSHIGAVAIATPYLALGAELHSIPLTHFAILGGLSVLCLGMLVTFYKGLEVGPVALVIPIISAHLIFVIFLSVLFLGEDIGSGQALGLVIVTTGIVLASMAVDGPFLRRIHLGKSVSYALLTMVSSGLFIFGVGVMSQELGWFLPVYLIRFSGLLILIPVQIRTRSISLWSPSLTIVLLAAMAGILQFIALTVVSIGAQVGSVSSVAAGFSIYPIIPVVGAFIFFHEKLVPRQAFGVVSVLVGLLVFQIVT